MAFAPISSFTLDGLPKFLSLVYHRIIENALYLFVELQLADRMIDAAPETGLTLNEILDQEKSVWNRDLALRLLHCCIDAGVVTNINDEEHFILTESGKMLVSNHPSHARDLVRFYLSPSLNQHFENGISLIRGESDGTIFDRITGGLNFYSFIHQPQQAALFKTFNGAMTALSLQAGDSLVANIPFDRFAKLVDIGGNQGTYLAQILKHYSSIQHGIVFDLPAVVNAVDLKKEFEIRGVSTERYSFVGGNMFNFSTIPYGDAYILKHILHNYDNEKVTAILSAIAKTNHTQRKSPLTIFIVESIIISSQSTGIWQIRAMDFIMAVGFNKAQVRTLQEHETLLKQAGFKIKQFYPVEAPNSIIEAVLVSSD